MAHAEVEIAPLPEARRVDWPLVILILGSALGLYAIAGFALYRLVTAIV